MMAKNPIKSFKIRLDDLWKQCLRKRDNNCCVMCGKTEGLSSHHWLVRKARSRAVRWEISNGATLCYYCHIMQLHMYGDKDFVEKFFAKMNEIVSAEEQERISDLGRIPDKWGMEELVEVETRLREYLVQGFVMMHERSMFGKKI